ncbi:MAG: hypothetical protein C0394_01585 [Syntrophus sp. (in: bacteria)]|nr:hypothetical protein [Syntrophus sp. (in: bacteria)]
MEKREKRHILTGGLTLVTLGALIVLHKTAVFGFDRSWPILLIVIGVGALVQRGRDIGGWFIAASGVILLLMQSMQMDFYGVSTYLLPLVVIAICANIILKYYRKKQ